MDQNLRKRLYLGLLLAAFGAFCLLTVSSLVYQANGFAFYDFFLWSTLMTILVGMGEAAFIRNRTLRYIGLGLTAVILGSFLFSILRWPLFPDPKWSIGSLLAVLVYAAFQEKNKGLLNYLSMIWLAFSLVQSMGSFDLIIEILFLQMPLSGLIALNAGILLFSSGPTQKQPKTASPPEEDEEIFVFEEDA